MILLFFVSSIYCVPEFFSRQNVNMEGEGGSDDVLFSNIHGRVLMGVGTHLLIYILNGFLCKFGNKLNSFKQIALASLVQICRTRSIYSRIAQEAI